MNNITRPGSIWNLISMKTKKRWFNDSYRIYKQSLTRQIFANRINEYFKKNPIREESSMVWVVLDKIKDEIYETEKIKQYLYEWMKKYYKKPNNLYLLLYLSGFSIERNIFAYNTHKFIYDDLFLVPVVYEDRVQNLLMMQIENGAIKNFNTISCIHVAIQDLSVDEFIESTANSESYKELVDESIDLLNSKFESSEYNTTSSENKKDVIKSLDLTEIFKAFNIWVKGIADAGMEGIQIQREVEEATMRGNQIATSLLTFLTSCYPEFIFEYIENVLERCKYQGEYHYNSLIANYFNLKQALSHMSQKHWYVVTKYVIDSLKTIEPNEIKILVDLLLSESEVTMIRLKQTTAYRHLKDLDLESIEDLEKLIRNKEPIKLGPDKYYILYYKSYGPKYKLKLTVELIVDIEM